MVLPARRGATYDDVLRAPPNMIAEVIFGVLHTQPRPTLRHAAASSHLGVVLGNPFRFGVGGPGGWVIYDEPEIHLGSAPDILVPDLAGWKRERLSDLAEDAAFTTIVPDWVCEVLSPSTQAIDRAEKMEIYGREQVNHVWLVDPIDPHTRSLCARRRRLAPARRVPRRRSRARSTVRGVRVPARSAVRHGSHPARV